ncbi:hypothetical protein [Lentilactobacillus parabuchneri]|uniref:hypothetical protein n=1 Tax=Lentilactobacillus parabuchneri TaxID=152331 RepID=UPI002307F02A|nr:hypothetical protein [Lentilactobacillus parabuchneri]MDB1104626.1 hypothetical protein [Lentilactobacillus parabuchneri]
MNTDEIVQAIQLLPKFKNVDASLVQMEVNDAISSLDVSKLPDAVQSTAIRYYACHSLLMQLQTDEGVKAYSMGPMSKTLISYPGNYDPYLQALNDLLDRYGANRNRGSVRTVD